VDDVTLVSPSEDSIAGRGVDAAIWKIRDQD
jgi:hypothetical protein